MVVLAASLSCFWL